MKRFQEPSNAGISCTSSRVARYAGRHPATILAVVALLWAAGCGLDGARDRETGPAGAPISSGGSDGPGAEAAAAVVSDYYGAIDGRDYQRAYRHWEGEGAASRQTFDEFRDGFARTRSVEVAVGEPGRIEGAAGSRYVEVPVRITAVSTDGTGERFRGSYVLRRVVVDGAKAEQRAWHIYSADLEPVR